MKNFDSFVNLPHDVWHILAYPRSTKEQRKARALAVATRPRNVPVFQFRVPPQIYWVMQYFEEVALFCIIARLTYGNDKTVIPNFYAELHDFLRVNEPDAHWLLFYTIRVGEEFGSNESNVERAARLMERDLAELTKRNIITCVDNSEDVSLTINDRYQDWVLSGAERGDLASFMSNYSANYSDGDRA